MNRTFMNTLSCLLLACFAISCVSAPPPRRQNPAPSSSTLRTSPEEYETNMETPGVRASEIKDDPEVEVKF